MARIVMKVWTVMDYLVSFALDTWRYAVIRKVGEKRQSAGAEPLLKFNDRRVYDCTKAAIPLEKPFKKGGIEDAHVAGPSGFPTNVNLRSLCRGFCYFWGISIAR